MCNNLLMHAMCCREIMDTMFTPQHYRRIYVYSYLWIALLTIPHSTAVTLCFPGISLANGTVLPVNHLSVLSL